MQMVPLMDKHVTCDLQGSRQAVTAVPMAAAHARLKRARWRAEACTHHGASLYPNGEAWTDGMDTERVWERGVGVGVCVYWGGVLLV